MIDLKNKEDFDQLKQDQFSVLLIWAEGCPVCEDAKPLFNELENKFQDYNFFKAQMDQTVYNFYIKYEEQQLVDVPALDEDGDEILDARGNRMTRKEMSYVTQIPKYYVFHASEATEDDQFGLLGKVDGHNLEMLEGILEQIKAMSEDEDE